MLTELKIPVAVHFLGLPFWYWQSGRGLTTEERVDNIDTDVSALNRCSYRTSETEYGVFTGGIHRGSANTRPRRLEARALETANKV
jgi:hypothetical protein